MKVIHFLLIFDHQEQKLIGEKQFTNGDAATQAYTEAEREHSEDRYEIVLVGADSIETIMKTHGSYFGPSDYSEILLTHALPG